MRNKNHYYVKQLKSGDYHVCKLSNNHPVYDDARDGNDAPLLFKDEDLAIEFRNILDKLIDKESKYTVINET